MTEVRSLLAAVRLTLHSRAVTDGGDASVLADGTAIRPTVPTLFPSAKPGVAVGPGRFEGRSDVRSSMASPVPRLLRALGSLTVLLLPPVLGACALQGPIPAAAPAQPDPSDRPQGAYMYLVAPPFPGGQAPAPLSASISSDDLAACYRLFGVDPGEVEDGPPEGEASICAKMFGMPRPAQPPPGYWDLAGPGGTFRWVFEGEARPYDPAKEAFLPVIRWPDGPGQGSALGSLPVPRMPRSGGVERGSMRLW